MLVLLDNVVPEAYNSHLADGACVARRDGSTLPCWRRLARYQPSGSG